MTTPARPTEPAPPLLDLSHTCHTRARTGVQRVTRALHAALGDRACPITHDPHAQCWRELAPWEHANLATHTGSARRGAQWPVAARWRGRAAHWLRKTPPALPANSGVIVPEVFSPAVARALPALLTTAGGPCVAVFHDAIALQFPELTPARTVARFPAYLLELLAFDGVAAVSEASRDALLDYWRWLGIASPPPVQAIPLGVDAGRRAGDAGANPEAPPVVLSVGSLEGRKNHVALLEACEHLWARGATFTLHLIGLTQPETGRAAAARIQALQAAGRPLRYDGAVSDAAVEAAYAACTFTVYPSLAEGFGLPVIESLAHGKPCICSARGALGESARGGGCLTLETMDATSLAAAVQRMISSPAERSALAAAAKARRFRTWANYARELEEWRRELTRRPEARIQPFRLP